MRRKSKRRGRRKEKEKEEGGRSNEVERMEKH